VNNETGLVRFAQKLQRSGVKEVYPLADAYQYESNFSSLSPSADASGTQQQADSELEEGQRLSPVSGLLHKKIKFLVGGEDMARGVDLPNISHVVVMDLPKEMQSFLHQSGRTGRMGKFGTVIAFYDTKNITRAKSFAGYLDLPDQLQEINFHLSTHSPVADSSPQATVRRVLYTNKPTLKQQKKTT